MIPPSCHVEKIVRFATVDCVKAGRLVNDKGIWSITGEGRAVRAKLTDPEVFCKRACKLCADWKAAPPHAETSVAAGAAVAASVADVENTAKAVSVTFEELEEQAWAEISQYLRAMNPYDSQELVADLLRAMSYHVTWLSPPGKDGGLDILAWPDALGTRLPRIKVQVKRQQQAVTVGPAAQQAKRRACELDGRRNLPGVDLQVGQSRLQARQRLALQVALCLRQQLRAHAPGLLASQQLAQRAMQPVQPITSTVGHADAPGLQQRRQVGLQLVQRRGVSRQRCRRRHALSALGQAAAQGLQCRRTQPGLFVEAGRQEAADQRMLAPARP